MPYKSKIDNEQVPDAQSILYIQRHLSGHLSMLLKESKFTVHKSMGWRRGFGDADVQCKGLRGSAILLFDSHRVSLLMRIVRSSQVGIAIYISINEVVRAISVIGRLKVERLLYDNIELLSTFQFGRRSY